MRVIHQGATDPIEDFDARRVRLVSLVNTSTTRAGPGFVYTR